MYPTTAMPAEGTLIVLKNDTPIFMTEYIFGIWDYWTEEQEIREKIESWGILEKPENYKDIEKYFGLYDEIPEKGIKIIWVEA